MGGNVLIPAVLITTLMLGTLTQLETLAKQSSEKTISYATDATNAIDCAYQARPLTECSPKLFSTDFKAQVKQEQAILKDLQAQAGTDLEAQALNKKQA